ncbi:MAG: hypothetical protein KIC80_05700 [Brachyspira sp.]|nr:hypothetical protein [Brachyspira sp.]
MEITSATSSKAAYVKGLDDEEEENEEQQVQEEKDTAVKSKDEGDQVSFASEDLDETTVNDKVSGFIQNLIAASNITDASKAQLQQYLDTFDVAKFIKSYGPFESVRDISAAMYAVTSGLIKYKEEE